jgi:hypothetical protein
MGYAGSPKASSKNWKTIRKCGRNFSHAISATCRAALKCNQNHPDYALDIFATLNCACACVSLVFFRVLMLPLPASSEINFGDLKNDFKNS